MDLRRKVIGIPLEKSMAKDETTGFLTIKGFFTSDNRDQVGDIITRTATERAVGAYRQWGNIRRMHAPDPVAKVLKIGTGDGLEWNEVEIQVIDPKAVFEVENGLLKALSVGILVDYEGIDFLEDGGWVINDYTLAEISLVDHPANYDAKLFLSLGLTVEDIREKGFEACKQIGLLEESMKVKGRNKKDLTPDTVAQAASEQVAEVAEVSHEVETEVVAEQEAQVATVDETEAPVEDTEPETASEEEEVPAEEVAPAEAEIEADAEVASAQVELSAVATSVKALEEAIVSMQASFSKALELISKSVSAQPEAAVESEADPEEPASEDASEVVDPISDLVKRISALEETVKASVPARRTAAIDATELIPDEADIEAAAESVERERPKNLRDAVTKFVQGS